MSTDMTKGQGQVKDSWRSKVGQKPDVPRGFPVSGCRKVCGVGEGDSTGAGGGSSPRSSME